MSKSHSFTDYVRNNLENELWTVLEKFIETTEITDLDLRHYRVKEIGEITIEDIDIKNVFVYDLPGSAISFDVIIDAALSVYDTDRYHNDEPEEIHQWFNVSCQGNLDLRLTDLFISSVCIYDYRNKADRPMSDSLVPYIRKNDLENEAERFLRKYYPEALVQPTAVDPSELARRMELTVIAHRISKDTSIFGQIYFSEADAVLYDKDSDTEKLERVRPGTIIVDPEVAFQRNLGAFNNTIVHECVHWDLHKKAFALEQLYNESISQIKCKVVGGIAGFSNEATHWMEWQANSLAPRIQMPLKMFTRKASEIINRFRKETGQQELCYIIQPVIEELAVFFNVSRLAAKLRMIDAGFEEARGAFIYIDGKYVKPFTYKKGTLKDNETYSISAKDAAIQEVINPKLQNAKHYLFIDSHFVLNHPKFVSENEDGMPEMTDYARLHMDKCCLSFQLSIKGNYNKDYHRECFLNRDKGTPVDFDITFTGENGELDDKQRIMLLKDIAIEEEQVLSRLTGDCTQAWKEVLKWRKISNAELSRRTGITEKTIGNIINQKSEGTLNNVVKMCLGAKLPYDISMKLVECTGYKFKPANDTHFLYKFVLKYMYTKPIEEIQIFLQQQGVATL